MRAKLFYLTMALVLVFSLAAAIVPVALAPVTQAQSGTVVLDDFEGGSSLTWVYMNDPEPPDVLCGDFYKGDGNDWFEGVRIREGGFGQIPGDTASFEDGSPLEIVIDPDDPGNKVLAWTFDGSVPNDCQDGKSYFDLILRLYDTNWSGYKAITFDVKATSTGGPSDRNYFRLITRLDQVGADPDDYFNADDEVWSAHKLDISYGEEEPIRPLPEPIGGWYTFEMNFDNVTDTYGGFWEAPDRYDIGGGSGTGDSPPPLWAGTLIARNHLKSFRFITWLFNTRWIASDETITVYFDNIELVPAEEGNGGDGCFIATAAYGTSTAAEIDTLRAFRDEVLLQSSLGSQLVALYYEVSPPVADFISEHEGLRTLVRELLVDPVAWLVEATGTLWRN